MALPKIAAPTFECLLPSTGDKLYYRPFLVKEEKVLLMAKESNDRADTVNAIKSIINSCVLNEEFDVNDITIFDMEYIFIKLRAASVGNIVQFQVEDSTDGITYDLELNLDEVEVKFPENHDRKIMVSEDIGMTLKYPTPEISTKLAKLKTVADITYETINHCIDVVFDSEDTYSWKTTSKKERDEFLDNLPIETYNDIQKFFETSPKIEHIINYTNSKDEEKRVVFRDLDDFFQLG